MCPVTAILEATTRGSGHQSPHQRSSNEDHGSGVGRRREEGCRCRPTVSRPAARIATHVAWMASADEGRRTRVPTPAAGTQRGDVRTSWRVPAVVPVRIWSPCCKRCASSARRPELMDPDIFGTACASCGCLPAGGLRETEQTAGDDVLIRWPSRSRYLSIASEVGWRIWSSGGVVL